jgi:hypothetical protein
LLYSLLRITKNNKDSIVNAHSNIKKNMWENTPTREDYKFFYSLPFLQHRAPLYGEKPETATDKVKSCCKETKKQIVSIAPDAPDPNMTTAKSHNTIVPFLRTPPVVVKSKVVVRAPQPRTVTILELFDIETPEIVLLGETLIQVKEHPTNGITYAQIGDETKGHAVFVSRFEVRGFSKISASGMPAHLAPEKIALHQKLRSRFIGAITSIAKPFKADVAYLSDIPTDSYVSVQTRRGTAIFLVIGARREKRMSYITSTKQALGVRFKTSVKIRRIPAALHQQAELPPEEEKLLEIIREAYASYATL